MPDNRCTSCHESPCTCEPWHVERPGRRRLVLAEEIERLTRERDEARGLLGHAPALRTEWDRIIRERDEARAEVAMMRAEVESQEVAHADAIERWRKLYDHQQRAHAPEVARWRAAALQYAAHLARLGHKVTLPDVPVAGKSTEDGGNGK